MHRKVLLDLKKTTMVKTVFGIFGATLNEKCEDLNDLHKEYISTSAQ